MTDHLTFVLSNLPTRPGVYQHKDADGTVIYVGKAKNLRSRVRSYFQESRPRDKRLQALVAKIADIEIIITDTEAEALLLENNLIKQIKPRYNVNLKDDKTYPYIVITNERFPRVFPTRYVRRDGSQYFGPYTDVKAMHQVLEAIRSLFKLRTCSLHLSEPAIEAGKFQSCLEFHIQRCAAPCIGLQSEAEYMETIRRIATLLNGHTRELGAMIEADMKRLAAAHRFEEAGQRRDQLRALDRYSERQKMDNTDMADRDIFALCVDRENDVAVGVLFKIREGKVLGRHHRVMRRVETESDAALMQTLLEQHYTEANFFPAEVLCSVAPEDEAVILAFLRDLRGKKVTLRVPERGDKASFIRLAESNAELILGEWKRQRAEQSAGRIPKSVESLQRDLRLPRPPRRIECFDISHLSGTGTVASCVVFEDGMPKKSDYRHFKVKTLDEGQIDDFASMREIVGRRYARLLEENGPWPDLVVIDGGKWQLSSAVAALQEAGVYGKFPVVGLAKRLEEIFFPGDSESVLIPRTSSSLHLVQRVRNEAHRFAVTFQRKQRQLTTLQVELTDVPGIGPATAQKLLTAFGSMKRIALATEEAIAEIAGKSAARKVVAHLRGGVAVDERPFET